MKKLYSSAIGILLLGIFFGCKKDNYFAATVVRDCTGTYLRWQDKDYHVCNTEKTEPFENGARVKTLFNSIKECNSPVIGQPVCDMYHQNEGWIEISIIK